MENPNTWKRENRNASFLHGLEDSFLYEPTPPTFDADELMQKTIVRPESSDSLVLRRFSQTPLAPEKLLDRTLSYPLAAENTLMLRIDDAAEKVGLKNTHYHAAMIQEVKLEHDRRIKGNSEAAVRLQKEIAGKILSDDDATLIWKARTGDANLSEAAELLLRYPAMGSIEAAKHTEPFNRNAEKAMRMHIQKSLFGIARQVSHPSRVNLTILNPHDARFDHRPMDMGIAIENEYARELQGFVRGFKENFAEAQRGDVTIQLVYKQTEELIHPDIQLKGEDTVPNIYIAQGQRVNLQNIGFACYWRVIENAK